MTKITRVEVIDENGRSYINWEDDEEKDISYQLQDDGRTLKVFVNKVKPKSPVEEAYKRWMDVYPPTGPSVDGIDDIRWRAFQMGYNASKESEYQPTPQEPEEVADGLKEAFREAVKQGIIHEVDKVSDVFMNEMVAELKGQTLTDIIWNWWGNVFTSNEDWDAENAIEHLVDLIEAFLPKSQNAEGSQNAYVECSVEGFNDCLDKIKNKLR